MEKDLEILEREVENLTAKLKVLKREIGKVIIGQDETVEQLITTNPSRKFLQPPFSPKSTSSHCFSLITISNINSQFLAASDVFSSG